MECAGECAVEWVGECAGECAGEWVGEWAVSGPATIFHSHFQKMCSGKFGHLIPEDFLKHGEDILAE